MRRLACTHHQAILGALSSEKKTRDPFRTATQPGHPYRHAPGPLEKADFDLVGQEVDPFIAANGKFHWPDDLCEILPSLEELRRAVSHLKFVGEHQRKVGRVAAVTDSEFLTIMPSIVAHFVSAEVKHFGFDEKERALAWLETGR